MCIINDDHTAMLNFSNSMYAWKSRIFISNLRLKGLDDNVFYKPNVKWFFVDEINKHIF